MFRCHCDTKTLLYHYKKIVVDITDYQVSILNQQLRLLRDFRYDFKEYGYVCKWLCMLELGYVYDCVNVKMSVVVHKHLDDGVTYLR